MQIADQKAVTIHYTLKDDEGTVLDSSKGREPLGYLHGVGSIVPGLEKALAGKAAGESVQVTLTPEEGYGVRDDKNVAQRPAAEDLRQEGDGRDAGSAPDVAREPRSRRSPPFAATTRPSISTTRWRG